MNRAYPYSWTHTDTHNYTYVRATRCHKNVVTCSLLVVTSTTYTLRYGPFYKFCCPNNFQQDSRVRTCTLIHVTTPTYSQFILCSNLVRGDHPQTGVVHASKLVVQEQQEWHKTR